jgi:hypothetical protein
MKSDMIMSKLCKVPYTNSLPPTTSTSAAAISGSASVGCAEVEDSDSREFIPVHHPEQTVVKVIGSSNFSKSSSGARGRGGSSSTSASMLSSSGQFGDRKIFQGFFDSVNSSEQARLDLLFAEACYTGGLPLSVVDNPFMKDFLQAIRPGWHPPSAYQLGNKLLDQTAAKVNRMVEQAIVDTANITVQADGWSDVNRKSVINIALYAGRPIFHSSVDPGAQRHNAEFIANTILNVVNGNCELSGQSAIDKYKFRSVVTDQPSVMRAAWDIISSKAPWINCCGCAAHVLNLLAVDLCNIDIVSETLDSNRNISRFFKSHSMVKEVLVEVTKQKFQKPLGTVLGCDTRWSSEFFMVRRNLRIKSGLLSASIDDRLKKEFRSSPEVKNALTSDSFWNHTAAVTYLLMPICTAIQCCEGDNACVSIMPRIWKHVESKLDKHSLQQYGFAESVSNAVDAAVQHRKSMNIQPITLASHALDPRFCGVHLSAEEWKVATDLILKMAAVEKLNRPRLLDDLMQYRSQSGPIFGDAVTWESVNTATCSRWPTSWWMSFAAGCEISKVAAILLSMPATAAIVERCNKSYATQKSKSRNRLLPGKAAKIASVSFNLKVNRSLSEPTVRQQKRCTKFNIMTLSTTSAKSNNANGEEFDSQAELAEPNTSGAVNIDENERNDLLQSSDSDSESESEGRILKLSFSQ